MYDAASDDPTRVVGYSHPDYDDITFYENEPDVSLVAKTGNRCYVAFRGTLLEVSDWMQNFDLASVDVYKDNITSTSNSSSNTGKP